MQRSDEEADLIAEGKALPDTKAIEKNYKHRRLLCLYRNNKHSLKFCVVLGVYSLKFCAILWQYSLKFCV